MSPPRERHRVVTPALDVALELSGPAKGAPLILLHGWPDDPRTWDGLLPALHGAGFRTFVPFLRGYGPTRFREASTMRSGQASVLARDVLELADALGLSRFALVGHDWGARTAYTAACLAPERVERCAGLSIAWGPFAPDLPLSMPQTQAFWYQWLLSLPRGERILREERHTFARHLWTVWNPGWDWPEADLAATAPSFDNPDWVDVVLHYYRSRWGVAPPDPSCDVIESRIAHDPVVKVPTLTLHGAADPCVTPEATEGKERFFASFYRRVLLPDLGHVPQRQAPAVVAAELVPFLTGA